MYKAPKKITSHPGVQSCTSAPDTGAPDYRHYVELKDGWVMPRGHRNEGGGSTFCNTVEEFLMLAPVQKEATPVQTKPATVEITTAPLRKDKEPRVVTIEKGTRVNRHFNNDGSITVYGSGVKLFRTASDEDIEEGVVAEDYDAEEAAERFIKRWFGKKPVMMGKDTRGHKWKKRAKKTPPTAG